MRNTRGSSFSLCRRSRTEPERYPRYPRLPVLRCAGWEAAVQAPPVGPEQAVQAPPAGPEEP